MTAKTTIDTLEKLIDQLLKVSGTERTVLCMTIESILDKFDAWLETSQDAKDLHPCPQGVSMFITEMKAPLHCLAGLNDYYTDMTQCVVWLKSGLRKMSMSSYLSV